MRRPVLRALMAVVGLTTLAVYLAVASLVYLLVGDVGQPNGFALGGGLGRGVVVVDRRLFGLLTLEELSATVAHELAHIDSRDSLVQTFGFSALQTLSSVVLLALLPVLLLTTGFARGLAWLRGRPGSGNGRSRDWSVGWSRRPSPRDCSR